MASDPREAYQRLVNELQHRARGGGGGMGGIPRLPKGLFAGGGAIAALIAGGVLLSASLYNGKIGFSSTFNPLNCKSSRWWSSRNQIFQVRS
jgi:hypothetical protein